MFNKFEKSAYLYKNYFDRITGMNYVFELYPDYIPLWPTFKSEYDGIVLFNIDLWKVNEPNCPMSCHQMRTDIDEGFAVPYYSTQYGVYHLFDIQCYM